MKLPKSGEFLWVWYDESAGLPAGFVVSRHIVELDPSYSLYVESLPIFPRLGSDERSDPDANFDRDRFRLAANAWARDKGKTLGIPVLIASTRRLKDKNRQRTT